MFTYENQCLQSDYHIIAGVDEAGRGPLAGPVACAAVIMPLNDLVEGVNDSKKLTAKRREELYRCIVEKAIAYQVVFISEQVIDQINILQATKLGMKQAVEALHVQPDMVLIDAVQLNLNMASRSIVHGDALSYLIAAASILAKVARDRFMVEIDREYPAYAFHQHKGYGTKLHYARIQEHGLCPYHRRSFLKNYHES